MFYGNLGKLGLGVAAAAMAASLQGQGMLLGVDTVTRTLIQINPLTGQSQTLFELDNVGGDTVGTIGALTYDPVSDTLFGSSTTAELLFQMDYRTGKSVSIGPFSAAPGPTIHGLEYDGSTGKLYGHGAIDDRFFEIDKTTGAATVLGHTGLGSQYGSLGYNSDSDVMYIASTTTDNLYSVNRATGALTLRGSLGFSGQVGVGMAYDADAGIMYAVDNVNDRLFTLDLSTGLGTLVGNLSHTNVISLVYVVPEPGTAGVLGVVGLALAARGRRAGNRR